MRRGELDLIGGPLQGMRLVEASAGTGKTYAVCLLYLRLLLERGLDVSQILVVSFTNAATAELRERIRARLTGALHRLGNRDEAEQDPALRDLLARYASEGRDFDALRNVLALAVADFDRSAIYTIHGFCKRVLDDEPFVTGLPLVLELVTDDAEIRDSVLADLYRAWLARHPPDAAMAARLWDPSTLKRLGRELQRRLAKPLAKLVWPEKAAPAAPLSANDDVSFQEARALWLQERATIVGILKAGRAQLNGNIFTDKTIEDGASQWDEVFTAGHIAEVNRFDWNRIDRYRRSCQKPKQRQAPIGEHRFFDLADIVAAVLARRADEVEASWFRLLELIVEDGPEAVRAAKQTQRVMSFDDLLHQLHGKLNASDAGATTLAGSLRARYPVALVDEFQDTDPQQYGVFKAIYQTGGSLFLVGDPKQAIYRFRNADLNVYFAASREAQAVETLTHNQRSSKDYLDALNALFGRNRAAFGLEDLQYHPLELGQKRRPPFSDSATSRAALQCWSLTTAAEGAPPTLQQARLWSAQATAADRKSTRLNSSHT